MNYPQLSTEKAVNKNNPLRLAAEGLQHPDGNTDKEDYMGNVANPIDTIPAVRALVDAIGEGIPSASRIFKVDERDLRRMVNDGELRPTIGRVVRWSKASLAAVGIGLELHVSSQGELEYNIVKERKA